MKKILQTLLTLLLILNAGVNIGFAKASNDVHKTKISKLIKKMTLEEKVGQMSQVNASNGQIPEELKAQVIAGQIGSLLNEVDLETVNKLQRLAVEKSRLGIPLLVARDVIHGFRTVMPIPLAQAASWNPGLVKKGARVAAVEAASAGVRWTFAPMIDITRDPRWGRIAESLGEDPYLVSVLSIAMIQGFQGEDLSNPDAIAACAKHFAAYGAAEGGRDYNSTYVPEILMRNVYLRPFKAAVDAGAATFMTSFNDNNGIPSTGNRFLLRQILKGEWGFNGMVISDWSSITEMIAHGYSVDEKEAAYKAVSAGVDMEMVSLSYRNQLAALVKSGDLSIRVIDEAVSNILRVKYDLGLFRNPYTDASLFPSFLNEEHLKVAKEAALESLVLLKNEGGLLPLSKDVGKVAVIGSLAEDKLEQLGTWIFDGRMEDSFNSLSAIQDLVGKSKVVYAKGVDYSRSMDEKGFDEAVSAAKNSDVVLLFLGEEAILSGEAHSRADINLPGVQTKLVDKIAAVGKPTVLVVMAGRPLTLLNVIDKVDALLYAWHPGTMGGPAIADVLFGLSSPSGKLPVTFPKSVGQIPLYYNHKNTGRPQPENSWRSMDSIPVHAPQFSAGSTSYYIDIGPSPLYPFGFGLSYSEFKYENLALSDSVMKMDAELSISAKITNTGKVAADEIVQLYTRDITASVTRPVKELKGFQKIRFKPGETKMVTFKLSPEDLAFYNNDMKLVTEPGIFQVWIAKNSDEGLMARFEIVN